MDDMVTRVRQVADAIVDRLYNSSSGDTSDEEQREMIDNMMHLFQQEDYNVSISSSSLRCLKKSRDARNFVKGETYLQDFCLIFAELRLLLVSIGKDASQLVFIDLGSGDGECLLAAAVSESLSFKHIVGYEVNHARVLESKVLLAVLQELYPRGITYAIFEQDFLAFSNWIEAAETNTETVYVIYACATCYTVDTISGIYNKAQQLKAKNPTNLVYLILLDQELELIAPLSSLSSPTGDIASISYSGSYCKEGKTLANIRTSWGEGTARIYQIK